MINISTSVFDGLVEADDKHPIRPELFETQAPSDDAMEWIGNVIGVERLAVAEGDALPHGNGRIVQKAWIEM